MSLIFGVNLSDRIYLSADTRLTIKDSKGKISFNDNLLKVQFLSKEIAVAAAGDAKMASFLVDKLYKSKVVQKGIRYCREHITNTVATLVDEYLQNNEYSKVVFVFGGLNRDSKKVIDGKKLMKIIKHYQEKVKKTMNMKEAIFQGISAKLGQPNPKPILPVSDSHLFSLKIEPPKTLEIIDAEWGKYLVYGAGLNEDNLPEITFGELEVSVNAGKPAYDKIALAHLIKSTAEIYGIETIGGAVVSFIINDNISGVLSGGVGRLDLATGEREPYYSYILIKNKKLYHRIGKNLDFELTPLRKFQFIKGKFTI